MKKNMGTADRKIRSTIGVILIVAAIILQVKVGRLWWIGLIGLVMLVTSSISFCPLYLPFKISTIKEK